MPSADAPADELARRAREIIESFRPYIQRDGGDIDFVGLADGFAQVRLRGACCGCPHAAMTLQMGVERQLCELLPEIKGVVNLP